MKTTRTYTLLLMLYHLLDDGKFTEEQICSELSLSRASFYRAVNDFRCFLQEHRPWQELKNASGGCYQLVSASEKKEKE
ncbi:MAG: hypothetical protein J5736_01845 [Bacilli bacterium]|nr:hypothetical protein [Bacilli bacterium]